MNRKPMCLDLSEMSIKGYRGVGTVVRENGENFIVVGRDTRALKEFWKRWETNFTPDKKKYKKTIVISSRHL